MVVIGGFATEDETRDTMDAIRAVLVDRGYADVELLARILEEETPSAAGRVPEREASAVYWRSVLRLVSERMHAGRIDSAIGAIDDALSGRDPRPRSGGGPQAPGEPGGGEDESGREPPPAEAIGDTGEQRSLRPPDSYVIVETGDVIVWRASHLAVVEYTECGRPWVATFWVDEEDGFPQLASSEHPADDPELEEHWAAIAAAGNARLGAALGSPRRRDVGGGGTSGEERGGSGEGPSGPGAE